MMAKVKVISSVIKFLWRNRRHKEDFEMTDLDTGEVTRVTKWSFARTLYKEGLILI